MNNSNPFVPKGSLLDQQSQRRSRLKLAVFCVLAVSVTGLTAMLIQGCKREKPAEDLSSMIDTNTPVFADTNPPVANTNIPVYQPPVSTGSNVAVNPLPPITPVVEAPITEGSEYKVAKGDTLEKIAKNHGVTLKAIQAANPNVKPTKMKIGDKITIPAGGKTSAEVAPTSAAPVIGESSTEAYKIKAGDTLTKIAKAHGTTVKAIQAVNNLTTTKIAVGKTLKIPVKVTAAPVAPVTPAAVEPMPLPPVTTPAPTVPAPVK
jgi:LysM repeat protein